MRQHLLNGLYDFRHPRIYSPMEVRHGDRRYGEGASHGPFPSKPTAEIASGTTIGTSSDGSYGPFRGLVRELPGRFGPRDPMTHERILHMATIQTAPAIPPSVMGVASLKEHGASTSPTRHPGPPFLQRMSPSTMDEEPIRWGHSLSVLKPVPITEMPVSSSGPCPLRLSRVALAGCVVSNPSLASASG